MGEAEQFIEEAPSSSVDYAQCFFEYWERTPTHGRKRSIGGAVAYATAAAPAALEHATYATRFGFLNGSIGSGGT